MRIRNRRGNTADNNALVLPKGHVVSDTEAHALRLHDNTTPGGFVITGDKVELPTGPGPTTLQAGTLERGYYGSLPAEDLLTFEDFKIESGVTDIAWGAGYTIFHKFSYQGKTIFIPDNAAGWDVTWETIYQAGLVYGVVGPGAHPYPDTNPVDQGVIWTIGGLKYRPRLMTGGNSSLSTGPGGEWDDLLLSLTGEGPTGDNWANLTYGDLGRPTNNSTYWCQEATRADGSYRVARGGGQTITTYGRQYADSPTAILWRPVLELVV